MFYLRKDLDGRREALVFPLSQDRDSISASFPGAAESCGRFEAVPVYAFPYLDSVSKVVQTTAARSCVAHFLQVRSHLINMPFLLQSIDHALTIARSRLDTIFVPLVLSENLLVHPANNTSSMSLTQVSISLYHL